MPNIFTVILTSVITFFTCELLRNVTDKLKRKKGNKR